MNTNFLDTPNEGTADGENRFGLINETEITEPATKVIVSNKEDAVTPLTMMIGNKYNNMHMQSRELLQQNT